MIRYEINQISGKGFEKYSFFEIENLEWNVEWHIR